MFFLRYYLVDMDDWPVVARVREEFLREPYPAAANLEVRRLVDPGVADRDRSAGGHRRGRCLRDRAGPRARALKPRHRDRVPAASASARSRCSATTSSGTTRCPGWRRRTRPTSTGSCRAGTPSGVNYVSLTVDFRVADRSGARPDRTSERQARDRSDWLDVRLDRQRRSAPRRRPAGWRSASTSRTRLPYGTNLDNVQTLADLGVRQAVLAYNNRNFVGDGCAEPDDAGLSLFGRALVRRDEPGRRARRRLACRPPDDARGDGGVRASGAVRLQPLQPVRRPGRTTATRRTTRCGRAPRPAE